MATEKVMVCVYRAPKGHAFGKPKARFVSDYIPDEEAGYMAEEVADALDEIEGLKEER